MGPLEGVKVIEVPNIGPMQFAGMLLSDLGAEVLRLDRASDAPNGVDRRRHRASCRRTRCSTAGGAARRST